MENSTSITFITSKSEHLKKLALSFNNATNNQKAFVLPKINEQIQPSTPKNNKRNNLAYVLGACSAAMQAVAGLMIIPGASLERRIAKKDIPQVLTEAGKEAYIDIKGKSYLNRLGSWLEKGEKFKDIGKRIGEFADKHAIKGKGINRFGWFMLSTSWLLSMPSCFGASVKAGQPSMLIGSGLWGISSMLMLRKKYQESAFLLGLLTLGNGFMYAGLANKIKNDKELKENEKPRFFNFNKINGSNFAEKAGTFVIDVVKDFAELPQAGIKAVKQSYNYLTGKRKELPEFCTLNPTENNSKLTSLMILPGAITRMTFGKENKIADRIASVLVGTGLLFESLYMFTLGNDKKDMDKPIIQSGVPFRIAGDYFQTNPILYGVRTLGGASFEYYYATLNKEDKK